VDCRSQTDVWAAEPSAPLAADAAPVGAEALGETGAGAAVTARSEPPLAAAAAGTAEAGSEPALDATASSEVAPDPASSTFAVGALTEVV
jgi:hypothetical protein